MNEETEIILDKVYYTTREAAKLAGLTTKAIREAIKRKSLKAEKFGNIYKISRRNLRTYLEKREGLHNGNE